MTVRLPVVSSATVSIVVAGMVSALLAPTATASVAGYAAPPGVVDPEDSAVEPDLPEPQVLTGTAPELVGERTETSRTFLQPDGSFRTVVFPSPVNYQANGSGWRRIDNTLVASPRDGYAVENAANEYRLLVPDDAGSAPVRFEADGEWVSFALADLDGAPQVSGSEATYADGLPGVQVEYEAAAEAAKESIILDAPPESNTFTFDLRASDGLRPRLAADGSIEFVDASGRRVMAMPAPFMFDSSGEPAGFSDDAMFGLKQQGTGGWTLSLTADRSWLTDSARVYPVMIDPTITAQPAAVDCWIWSGAPAAGNCGAAADFLRVGHTGAGENIRSLLRFNLSNIPANATVTSGDLELYLDASQSASGLSADYVVRRVLKSWTGQASWNRYDGTNLWTNPGGDFGGTDAGRRTMDGALSGYKSFDATWLVNEWVQGTSPNQGMIVKQAPESTANTLYFYSSNAMNETRLPKLTVSYTEPPPPVFDRTGNRRFSTYETQALNDRMQASVNVSSGNLLLRETDLQIAGTGLGVVLDRFYNSLATTPDPSRLSPGWSLGTAPTVRLEFPGTADRVVFVGPSSYRVRFDTNADGDYIHAEPGADADLEFDTASNTYRLEWFNKATYVFDTAGKLLRTQDGQGNQITYTYAADGSLDFLTDTQGREVDFTYNAGLLDTVTDEAAGRVFNYDYAQFGVDPTWRLASFAVTAYGLGTDNLNLNKLTSFGYDGSGRMTSITDPRGNTAQIGYDGTTRRVATITRVTADTTDTNPTTTFTYPTTIGQDCTDPKTVARTVVDAERTSVTDTTTYCLDSHDRVVQTVDAKGHTRSGEYTSNSNLTTLNESGVTGGPAFDYRYGNTDNLNRVTLPTGGRAFSDYTDSTNPHLPTAVRDFSVGSATGPATWVYDYDSKGNLIEAHNPTEGVTFRYCYDGKGQVQRIDPPPTGTTLDNDSGAGCGTANQDNDTLFSYDSQGNLTTVNPPGPHGALTYTYDAVSRVKTVTDGRGVVATASYDALDQITGVVYAHPTLGSTGVSYSYDENGNLTARQDATGNTNYTYDELNRMTDEAPEQPASSTDYTYDLAGNLTSIEVTEEPAPVTYTYNNLNLVTSVTDQRGLTTTFGYNNRDLRTSTAYPNGVTQEARWDNSRRLNCIYAYTGDGPGNGPNACPAASTSLLTFFDYDYTTPGGVDTTTRYGVTTRNGSTTTYSYDALMRLTRARRTSDTGTELSDYQYILGARGNITRETVTGSSVPNTTTTFAYNAASELCWTAPGTPANACASSPPGATLYSYDNAGNLASTSDGLSASYNQLAQTTQITPPGGQPFSMEYGDVTQDRRTGAGDQRIAYNQLGLASQGPNSGVPHASWFVRDPSGTLVAMVDRNDDEKDLYYLYDGLGSVAATVRNNQIVDRRYTYDPYGEQISPDPTTDTADINPWRYTSEASRV